MKERSLELVFILDESGSMYDMKKDTIGGFNATLEKQKKEEGQCLVSTVLFNTQNRVIHDRVRLNDVPFMKDEDYSPSGSTALIDAVGDAIRHISMVHRYIREEDRPEKTLFIITTDGMENASRRYGLKDVKKMIEEKKKIGWEFIFLAANIDAYETAREYGFDEGSTVNYVNDERGNEIKFACMSEAISSLRTKGRLSKSWNADVMADFEERGSR